METELPDGTICEFFTSEDENLSSTGPESSVSDSDSDDEGSTCDPAVTDAERTHSDSILMKRKASDDPLAQLDGLISCKKNQVKRESAKRMRKSVDIFDFEGIIEALENGTVRLPSTNWSYSLLNRSVLMLLCWDENLRLTKKAVLRKGFFLELFCDDRLLASKAELPVGNYYELELALCYLDKYEWCHGADPDERLPECELYTLNGKSYCAACDNWMAESCVEKIVIKAECQN